VCPFFLSPGYFFGRQRLRHLQNLHPWPGGVLSPLLPSPCVRAGKLSLPHRCFFSEMFADPCFSSREFAEDPCNFPKEAQKARQLPFSQLSKRVKSRLRDYPLAPPGSFSSLFFLRPPSLDNFFTNHPKPSGPHETNSSLYAYFA